MHKPITLFFACSLLSPAQDPTPDLGWQAVSRMQDARYDHCAVSLGDGRVFVAGGIGPTGPLITAEIYGPNDSFKQAASMSVARAQPSCSLLADGRVLVAGGANQASAELFNPFSGTWTPVSGPMLARRGQTASTLPLGRILIAGGYINDQPTNALEIYDPEAERISPVSGGLAEARARHSAVSLSDGRVLLIGGTDGSRSLASTEIFDPLSNMVGSGPSLHESRAGHITATLIDGRVLVAGGTNGSLDLGSGEIYSESTNQFSPLSSTLTIPRQNAFAIAIPGTGLVLIGGGEANGQALPDTELFDPVRNEFVVAGALTAARTRIQGAVLSTGLILGVGGQNADGPSNACGVFAVPQLSFTKAQYASGETAVVNGSGFLHTAGQTILLFLTATNTDGTARSTPPQRLLTNNVSPNAAGQFQANIATMFSD